MKKKLVVIGAGEFQLPLILKAKELGFEVHAFAWADGAVAKDACDRFYPISITEYDAILEECKKIQPSGIVTIGSDLASPTVCYLSEKLGLTSNPFETAKMCTNKYQMRRVFQAAGLPVPFFKLVAETDSLNPNQIPYPVIVKPTDRSGSRGIFLVERKEQLMPALQVSIGHSFDKNAIIEGFIPGNEYSCECISYHGQHHFLAITKKYTTGAPNYIETGHIQPCDISPEMQEKIKAHIFDALTALGIQNGASHTEFKVDHKGNFGIIEIGARMGGDCIGSDLVYLSTGYDFLKMVIDVACGIAPQVVPTGVAYKQARITFLFDEADIAKLEALKQSDPDSIYRISDIEMENLGKTTDSASRLGYYITVK